MIVSLSGGALTAFRPQSPVVGTLLFLPIALSILHQTCIYMAEQKEARSAWNALLQDIQIQFLDTIKPTPPDRPERVEKIWADTGMGGIHDDAASVKWFIWAD